MPWKNGGGETTEILAHPAGAGLDAFDWRISMARVAADGPFSAFPGIDRTLTVLDGAGLDLAIGGAAPVRLDPASGPLSFPADSPCHGRLVAGPVTDLNVMTRRGRFFHAVTRFDGTDGLPEVPAGGIVLVLCLAGRMPSGSGDAMLGPRDAVVLAPGDTWRPPAPDVVAALAVVVGPA
ncbi:HutD family protein [Lichenibacterium ramalinae]|jgi:hypothetical protein|uniref:HutD family protein n=2 Tax=Lichenibacterium ramalinae TaxID=2316527 RepID=A0A4V1RJB0_9HYPH|nr:HutD family protein [Lichenibacterium ramalinae]